MKPSLNIGIEEEYQTIDPVTRDLRSHILAEIVPKGRTLLHEHVKPEMHQSVVEIGTGVCRNIQEANAEIRAIRRADSQTRARERPASFRGRHAPIRRVASIRRSTRTTATA